MAARFSFREDVNTMSGGCFGDCQMVCKNMFSSIRKRDLFALQMIILVIFYEGLFCGAMRVIVIIRLGFIFRLE